MAAPRPPADAVVALRSMGRRWRAALAEVADDERPDDVAHRTGGDGRSALHHLAAATGMIVRLDGDLHATLTDTDPMLRPAVLDGNEGPDTAEAGLAALVSAADASSDRAGRVSASQWARSARLDGGGSTTALALLWDAVDGAVAHLRSAERVLREVRGS